MELLYIWIDNNDKNIKKQGFNFSPKYWFDFVPDFAQDEKGNKIVTGGTLTCTENDFPDNFFGEGISNVTAIVGKNGSGKSSLLEFILMNVCQDNSFGYHTKYFLILKTNNKIQIVVSPEFDIIIPKILERVSLLSYTERSYNYIMTINSYDIAFILYSDITNYKNVLQTYKLYNLTSWKILKEFKNDVDNYNIYETLQQIFFVNIPNLQSYIPFELPKYVNLSIDFTLKKDREDITNDIYGKCLSLQYHLEEKFRSETLTYRDIVIHHLIFCLYKCKKDSFYIESFFSKLSNNSYESDFINFIQKHKEMSLICRLLNHFLMIFENNIIGKPIKRRLSHNNGDNQYIFDILIKADETYFKDLLNTYKEIFVLTRYYFVKLEWWKLSSGEHTFLKLFSRFYTASYLNTDSHYSINYNKHLIILIDEGELGLHPQWQKEYLKNLIGVLPKIFEGKTIQIILTSHSPFLVSDLPKENIIFLEKEKETGKCIVKNSLNDMKQTFGANIHTLLTDSFFMHDKGLMGHFAEGKINDVILWLNDGSNNNIKELAEKQNPPKQEIEIVQWLIKQIGEPIIRNQLQKMLDSRRLAKVETHDEQIKNLESIVSTMQKHIEELRNKK